ncbi:MAG: bifunctional sulfate adenylyltransferase/adenylylsulfate kinase [Deltaproteobacteria bacterium]|nr:bifunctional sulfate adenylyltransferase/adenylylsulfate kinase [Deltaproteobacteria bacterium]
MPPVASLVNLVVDEERRRLLKDLSFSLPDISLNERQLCDLELLATGVFSPLDGFMTRSDYESVLDRMRLQDGTLWPLPITLDVSETTVKHLETGQSVALRDPEGFLLAILHIDEIWPLDREKEAQRVYGTTDTHHPGVHYLYHRSGDYCVGGKLEVLNPPLRFDFKQNRLTPGEVREIYKKLGWKRIVGFQTRHPIHRPHFEMTLHAMRQANANLLLLPIVGMTKPGDFDHYTRVRCHKLIGHHYPPDSHILNLLPLAMRMAGPREALLHAIIARNFGCTHFIVGHDHAGPGKDAKGHDYYPAEAARQTAEELSDEIGIDIISLNEMVYLPFEDEFRFSDHIPEGTQTISMSGTDIRGRIGSGKRIPAWITFPEVIAELRRSFPPPRRRGFTVFMTGLSGAGKSTIAQVLFSKFLEKGDRPVSLLDGDIVRRNLSSKLTFSKEDRDINVRRIGFVASEITKNRGIAICAPIAPYEITRREIRQVIEAYGGFFEVHVATPLETCEKRDRKGMYAKARAGLIKGFTGVDDPYEAPQHPEVVVDTTELTPDEAAQRILIVLGQQGYI